MSDEPIVRVDWEKHLVLRDGTEFPFHPHEYWTLAPSRSTWEAGDGRVGPLDFAFMLHNARMGMGVMPPLQVLAAHFEARTLKSGNPAVAERLIEARRLAMFPEKPSRLRSYFLNTHRDVAEKRADLWDWTDRTLVRCHLLTTTGSLHNGLVSRFEAVVGDPTSRDLADRYWQEEVRIVSADNKHDVEVLADCGLYFPDWETFDGLDADGLMEAQRTYGTVWRSLGRSGGGFF